MRLIYSEELNSISGGRSRSFQPQSSAQNNESYNSTSFAQSNSASTTSSDSGSYVMYMPSYEELMAIMNSLYG